MKNGICIIIVMFCICTLNAQSQDEKATVKFPLKVSKNHRYLMDQDSRPFLVVGDTAWSLIADLKETDIKTYLDDRQQRGFNSIIVSLIEHQFSTDPPRTHAGIEPFLNKGDFSTPNPKYFQFAHQVIRWANERGISVWLCPAYLGWNGGEQGFFQEITKGGVQRLKKYGRFIGNQFKDLPNIVWMLGGDYALPKKFHWTITALAEAIQAGGAKQLMTVHGGQQSALDVVGNKDWIAINNTYSYDREIFRVYQKDYQRKPTRPFVLIESIYEHEHNSTPAQIRRQAYWAMTCGACGQFFGNNPIWHFDGPGLFRAPHDWKKELNSVGSQDMSRLRKAFIDRDWHLLVPDFKHRLVTEGISDGVETITGAISSDRKLAYIYIPSTGRDAREFSIEASQFSGEVSASWLNPTSGKTISISTKSFEKVKLRTPGDNGKKSNDWLLILEVGS